MAEIDLNHLSGIIHNLRQILIFKITALTYLRILKELK
jgi:hypothetical protein